MCSYFNFFFFFFYVQLEQIGHIKMDFNGDLAQQNISTSLTRYSFFFFPFSFYNEFWRSLVVKRENAVTAFLRPEAPSIFTSIHWTESLYTVTAIKGPAHFAFRTLSGGFS